MRIFITFRSMFSSLLIVSMLCNHTLAFTQGVSGVLQAEQQNLAFWWQSKGYAAKYNSLFPAKTIAQAPKGWDGIGAPAIPRPKPDAPETKEDRERKVFSVEIFPGDIAMETGQKTAFVAVARDKDGAPVGGIDTIWEGFDEEKSKSITVSQQATFTSNLPGKFKLTATIAGRKAHVKVTVFGTERLPNIKSSMSESVSSQDQPKPKKISSLLPVTSGDTSQISSLRNVKPTAQRPLRAAKSAFSASAALFVDPGEDAFGWNSSNFTTIDDTGTERGNMPGHTPTGEGSGNFQFSAPMLSQDGRGLDLNLGLYHNSRLWHKSGTEMYFDPDRDWVPGWTFGFGKIIMAGTSYIMADPDGTRHSYGGEAHSGFGGTLNSLQTFEAYTADGSFINYYAEGYNGGVGNNSFGHNVRTAWAKLPNGTTIDYGASANYAIYPIKITDANGNYITITYRTYLRKWPGANPANNDEVTVPEGPSIETITDTLGRTIQFHYQRIGTGYTTKDLLTAVTAPGYNGGTPRVVMRLQYQSRNLSNAGANYGFSGVTTKVHDNGIYDEIKSIYYPATGTGYWFGDTNSYSNYGMVRKVSERRGMTCTVGGGACENFAQLNQQPTTVTAGSMSQEMTYSHTSQAGYSDIAGPLYDTPTYNQMTENWAARHTAAAPITTYSKVDLGTTVRTTTINPDGVRIEQDTDDDPNSLYYGLLKEDRTYQDANSSVMLHRSVVTWFRTGLPSTDWLNTDPTYRSARPSRIELTDDRGQVTATDFSYGYFYNQVENKTDYGYGGVVRLNRTYSEYENDLTYRGNWANRGTLFFDGGTYPIWSGPHIFSLVKDSSIYAADNTTPVAHTRLRYDEQALAPCNGLVLASAPVQRGNITTTKSYANAAALDETTAIVETNSYDIAGNIVTKMSGNPQALPTSTCCQKTTFSFVLGNQYTWPISITTGSAGDAMKQNVTVLNYDLSTGLLKDSTDANGGGNSSTQYDPLTLRPVYVWSPAGAYTYHIYQDNSLVFYDISYEALQSGSNWVSRSDQYIDGKGRVHGEISYGKNFVSDSALRKFDNLDRLWQETRPYRTTPEFYTYEYDLLGRNTKITEPDGAMVQRFYNEASYPSSATPGVPGQVVRSKDQWGRERWARYDEQSRLAEVVEPNSDTAINQNPSGTVAAAGNMKTNFAYDTLGNLTQTAQGDQTRTFQYDALSRLTRQKLAERDGTLNSAGQYLGAGTGGQWSDVFSYDTRSNMTQRVDARGVRANLFYNNDPLNRLQAMQYDTTGVPAGMIGNIPTSPNVTFGYMATGDKKRVQYVYVDFGFGNQVLSYDSVGRIAQMYQSFTGRESNPIVSNYLWDSVDRLKEHTYSYQWGQAGNPRKKVEMAYDIASRVDSLKFDGVNRASSPIYNAASEIESLSIGSLMTETFTYDSKTGLMLTQKVQQGATTRLDLKYNYTLNNDPNNVGAKTGQLTCVTDNISFVRNKAYKYYNLGRLKEGRGGSNAFSSPQWSQIYSYDRYGNRTSIGLGGSGAPVDGIASLSYVNGSNQTLNNRITTAGYEYDPAGNQTRGLTDSGAWQRYKYDSAGRLAQVLSDASVPLETYSYGGTNQRLMTTFSSGPATYYAWEGDQVIGEFSAAGASGLSWNKNYVYLSGRLLTTITPSSTQYHHPDRLGTRLITDATTGAVTTEQANLPFGTPLAVESSGTNSNRRFTSYDRSDTTKLDYAVNRFYNSAQGRFTQVDPIGMSATALSEPQTLNLYAYCANDPINCTDPDGLNFFKKLWGGVKKSLKWIAVAAAIAIAVLTIIYAPALSVWTLKIAFGVISAVANAASTVLNAFGLKTASTVLGIIGAGFSFGSAVLSSIAAHGAKQAAIAAKEIAEKIAVKSAKFAQSVWKAVASGASLASKTMSAFGHKTVAKVLGLASTVTGFIGDGYKETPDGKKVIYRFGAAETYKFIRSAAEQVAGLIGLGRIANYLNVAGLPEDIHSLLSPVAEEDGKFLVSSTKPGTFSLNIWKAFTKVNTYKAVQSKVGNISSIIGRVEKGVALSN